MKVLIAEDAAAISRTILKKSAEKFGHECLVAENGLKLCRKPLIWFDIEAGAGRRNG